jgi:hypothetical protein
MYFNIVFNEFRFHGLFISLSTFNWRHSPKSLSSAETDLVESTTVQQLWACVTTKKLTPPWKILEPFYPPSTFSQINRARPPPGFFTRAKRAKAIKFAREARIKICALTFETCRSSDVYNYMIFSREHVVLARL